MPVLIGIALGAPWDQGSPHRAIFKMTVGSIFEHLFLQAKPNSRAAEML